MIPQMVSIPYDFSLGTACCLSTPVFLFALAFVFWRFAPSISRLMIRGIETDITFTTLTRADLYCFAFVLVGLWYFLSSIPNALNWIHYLLKIAAEGQKNETLGSSDIYALSQAMISMVFGVACIVAAPRWAKLLLRNEKN
ncbi:MAG: hypothetical protein PHD76_00960 [Methylacidiphilales bacterium]|nr:hypothetical protein [Candidatus Methylacidiphilales bacterium]